MSRGEQIERMADVFLLWAALRQAVEGKAKEINASPKAVAEALTMGAAMFTVLAADKGAERESCLSALKTFAAVCDTVIEEGEP